MLLFQYQKGHNHGFSLLELLIVIVIIAMILTMVMLNVNLGRGNSVLKDSSRRLHAVLQQASEESILFNKSLGINFEEYKYTFYELVEKKAEKDSEENECKNKFLLQANVNNCKKSTSKSRSSNNRVWKAIEKEAKKKGIFSAITLPKYHHFNISIEGTFISLKEDIFEAFNEDKKKAIKPTLFITPDGEIFPDFEIQIQHQYSGAYASIQLNENGELVLKLKNRTEQ